MERERIEYTEPLRIGPREWRIRTRIWKGFRWGYEWRWPGGEWQSEGWHVIDPRTGWKIWPQEIATVMERERDKGRAQLAQARQAREAA